MPPKGKRAASKPPGSEAKKSKTATPEQDSVLEVLSRSSSLTADAQAMLAAMLPHSLGVFSDDRDERQNMVVGMFEETISSIKADLQSSREAATAKVSEAESAKDKLAEEAVACEARLKERQDAAESAKTALATRKEAAKAAAAELAKAESDVKGFQASNEEKRQFRATLGELLEGELKQLKEGTFADVQEAKKLAATLMKVTTKLGLEASLNSALQPTCTKAPADRSSFDNMVLEQVTTEVTKKEGELKQELDAAESNFAALQSAAEAAKTVNDAAHADQEAGASALKEAQQLEGEAKDALKAATKASDGAEPAIAKAKKALGVAEATLAAFEASAVRSFEALRDSKRPQPAMEAPAETPVKDAQEAAAQPSEP